MPIRVTKPKFKPTYTSKAYREYLQRNMGVVWSDMLFEQCNRIGFATLLLALQAGRPIPTPSPRLPRTELTKYNRHWTPT